MNHPTNISLLGVVTLLILIVVELQHSECASIPSNSSSVENPSYPKNGIIRLGSTLRSNQTWLSANGTFVLGYFGVRVNESVVGIWYANISKRTVVWMVNRDALVDAKASYFQLTTSGEYALFERGRVVWQTKTGSKSVVEGVLEASGNLILKADGEQEAIWESFNFPTDTLLPGQRFTIESTNLISWRIAGMDPTAGDFMLAMNPDVSLRLYFNVTQNTRIEYWTSGLFSLIDHAPRTGVAMLNDSGVLVVRSSATFVQSFSASDSGKLSTVPRRLTLDANGNLAIYSWSVSEESWIAVWRPLSNACKINGACGNGMCKLSNMSDMTQYDCSCPEGFLRADLEVWSKGCRRAVPLRCDPNPSSGIRMRQYQNVYYLGPATVFNQVASAQDCSNLCLHNCSCVFASYATDGTKQCWIHSDMLYGGFNDAGQPYTFILKLALTESLNSELDNHGGRRLSSAAAVVGVCVSVVSAIFVLMILVWIFSIRKKAAVLTRDWSLRSTTGLPIKFTYKELEAATQHFKQKIGSGGFGEVYKGVLLTDGSLIAVKKLQGSSEVGEEQFQAEVSTIGSIHHTNIVHLRGFCCEGSHRLLVYEYMEHGSLDRFLFKRASGKRVEPLDWDARYNIAIGIAKGIAYFHEQCRNRIIHCDIKPENILLTKDFSPKVSDFGLAKLMRKSQTRIITAVRGTRGYVAPEWLSNLPVTAKADVYSFGMLLLEMVGGRRNMDLSVSSQKVFYPYWAFEELRTRGGLQEAMVVDEALRAEYDGDQVRRVLNVGFWCIQDEAGMRPSMGTVVKMLEGSMQFLEAPLPNSIMNLMKKLEEEEEKDGDADGEAMAVKSGSEKFPIVF